MNFDESSLSKALRSIEAAPESGLAERARRGGRRRLARRRAGVATGVLVVGAAAVPVSDALRSSSSGAIGPAQSTPRLYAGLYAAPPVAGSQCASGLNGPVPPAGKHLADVYPELLLLPRDRPVSYAFVHDERQACVPAHVALTAVQTDLSGSVTHGLVVEGPNAPTALEDGWGVAGSHFGGETGSEPILGVPGAELTVTQNGHTDAYWTEPDGGQWHALVHNLPQDQAVALLDQVRIDARTGTATLTGSARDKWTVEPSVPDAPQVDGIAYSRWLDADGHVVDLTVTSGPNRIEQNAAGGPASLMFTTIRGHRATVFMTAGDAEAAWQESADAEVDLQVKGADVAEVQQVADSLSLAAPTDPRIKPTRQ